MPKSKRQFAPFSENEPFNESGAAKEEGDVLDEEKEKLGEEDDDELGLDKDKDDEDEDDEDDPSAGDESY